MKPYARYLGTSGQKKLCWLHPEPALTPSGEPSARAVRRLCSSSWRSGAECSQRGTDRAKELLLWPDLDPNARNLRETVSLVWSRGRLEMPAESRIRGW